MQVLNTCKHVNKRGFAKARQINPYLRPWGYELRFSRKDSYWYFNPLHTNCVSIESQGLYAVSLEHETIASIAQELIRRIREREL